jgi:SAM-dependent methyltransferase
LRADGKECAMTNFVQDVDYAKHFLAYRELLGKMLDHDPRMFELSQSARIADVGCGYGDTLLTLRDRGYAHLIGVEPDPAERAAAISKGLDVREGTLNRTGLAGSSVDAALVINVFHHLQDPFSACDEMARIIVPGGVLCYIEPRRSAARVAMDFLTFWTPLRFFSDRVMMRYRVMKLEMDTGLYWRWLWSEPEFKAALAKAGFTSVWERKDHFFQYAKMRLDT